MSIIERAKNICLTPATEWPVIAAEPTSPGTLVSSYVVPLAAVGAIAGFIGGSLIGHTLPLLGTYRVPLVTGLVAALFTFCMAIGWDLFFIHVGPGTMGNSSVMKRIISNEMLPEPAITPARNSVTGTRPSRRTRPVSMRERM